MPPQGPDGFPRRGVPVLPVTTDRGEMSGTDEFEGKEKDSRKPNERLHDVVEDKGRKREGEGEGTEAGEDQPYWLLPSGMFNVLTSNCRDS